MFVSSLSNIYDMENIIIIELLNPINKLDYNGLLSMTRIVCNRGESLENYRRENAGQNGRARLPVTQMDVGLSTFHGEDVCIF